MSSLIMEERAKRVVKKEREDDGEIWKKRRANVLLWRSALS